MSKIISTNPARNYEIIGEVDSSSDAEIQNAITSANNAKRAWKETSLQSRIEILRPVLNELKQRSDEIADLMTREMGKPITQSRTEVEDYTHEFGWMLDNVEKSLQPVITDETDEIKSYITYEPYGTVAVITPWNFPFGLSILGIIPNLLVGNTVIYKASEETILLGKLIVEIFNNHNLPEGVFTQLFGAGDVGEKLARSKVDFIWFTGSTKIGQKLYQIAAEKFINVLLEMGGSSPCIVFDDADIDTAVDIVYENRFLNTGQVCDIIKRAIVHESVFDEFVDKMKVLISNKVMSDPTQDSTDLGPLVAERQVVMLEQQVNDSIEMGVNVVMGGKRFAGIEGAYYEPTLLTGVTKDMRVWKEEVFGPVLPVVKFSTEDEAIELANDSEYGLGGRVISADIDRARRVAGKIDAGSIDINKGDRWTSPNNPFGGYKKSGIGRENGSVGFRSLCQIKLISESK